MPKMVLCFEVGQDPEFAQGKFWEERSIPKGWIIDRDMHKPIVDTEAIKKEMTTDELKQIGITVLPPTTEGLDITGQPESLTGKFLRAKEHGKSKPISTTVGLDITGQPDSFKEGDVIGESTALPVKKKPGPKPKVKP